MTAVAERQAAYQLQLWRDLTGKIRVGIKRRCYNETGGYIERPLDTPEYGWLLATARRHF